MKYRLVNPRPAGPLDFPPPAGGGGVWTPPPPSISAPAHRRTKRKTAFETSRKIISKSFRSFFSSGQNWGHQGSKFQNFPKRFLDDCSALHLGNSAEYRTRPPTFPHSPFFVQTPIPPPDLSRTPTLCRHIKPISCLADALLQESAVSSQQSANIGDPYPGPVGRTGAKARGSSVSNRPADRGLRRRDDPKGGGSIVAEHAARWQHWTEAASKWSTPEVNESLTEKHE